MESKSGLRVAYVLPDGSQCCCFGVADAAAGRACSSETVDIKKT